MIFENRRISAKIIAETQQISCKRLDLIIYNILDLRKLPAKWVPKFLNADQKRIRVTTSKTILDRSTTGEAGFITKQQSMEWDHNGSLCLKKFRTQNSIGKILAAVF
ncbi:uncharacterized protein LOC115227675 [Octopus sinensis]|uniref:Uncharacterized protein LOC115227675 n=1 Tax=Octopus sinensis TaxID=2607531 RepID=A0A6P7TYF4_9MOLL|nr:uncharacterized protein LOC115227675 [Octopus sinensis]